MLNKREASSKQERLVATLLGWRVVSGSGARPTHVGDIISDDWIGECKTHVDPGHRIVFAADVWKKIKDEANSKFKYPVLICDDGSQTTEYTWCMFDKLDTVIDYDVISYPFEVRTNVTFDSTTLAKHITTTNRVVVYSLHDNRFICSLITFYRIIKGEE